MICVFGQMMEEVFVHLSGSSSSMPAMVQVLADFALIDGLYFPFRYCFGFSFLVAGLDLYKLSMVTEIGGFDLRFSMLLKLCSSLQDLNRYLHEFYQFWVT